MLRDTPGHRDRHGTKGTALGFGKQLDPLGDSLEARTLVCRQARQGLVELRAM